jgi:hypothetical protein
MTARYVQGVVGGAVIGLIATYFTRPRPAGPIKNNGDGTSIRIGAAIKTEPGAVEALDTISKTNSVQAQKIAYAANKLASFWLTMERSLTEEEFVKAEKGGGAVLAHNAYEQVLTAIRDFCSKIDTSPSSSSPIPLPSDPTLRTAVHELLSACENWRGNAVVAFDERRLEYAHQRATRLGEEADARSKISTE